MKRFTSIIMLSSLTAFSSPSFSDFYGSVSFGGSSETQNLAKLDNAEGLIVSFGYDNGIVGVDLSNDRRATTISPYFVYHGTIEFKAGPSVCAFRDASYTQDGFDESINSQTMYGGFISLSKGPIVFRYAHLKGDFDFDPTRVVGYDADENPIIEHGDAYSETIKSNQIWLGYMKKFNL